MRGEWAGHEGKVLAAEQDGTVVVELCDAANAPLLLLEDVDCGRIMPQPK